MSYTPTTWQSGDTVTSEKLNKLETGVQNGFGGMFLINAEITVDESDETTGTVTVDKTFSEIKDAYDNGKLIILQAVTSIDPIFPLWLYPATMLIVENTGLLAFSMMSNTEYMVKNTVVTLQFNNGELTRGNYMLVNTSIPHES